VCMYVCMYVGMTLYIFVCGNACRRKQGQRDHIAAVAATAALKIELHRVIFSGFPTYFEQILRRSLASLPPEIKVK